MKKINGTTFYTAEDFIQGRIEPQLKEGLNFNIDRISDENNDKHVDVWISDDDGNTIEEKIGLKTDDEILEAINYLGRKYE